MILVQDVTPEPGKYPLSCLYLNIIRYDISAGCYARTWKISSFISLFKHNKMILVQDVTSEPGKYPLSCLYLNIIRCPPNSTNLSSHSLHKMFVKP